MDISKIVLGLAAVSIMSIGSIQAASNSDEAAKAQAAPAAECNGGDCTSTDNAGSCTQTTPPAPQKVKIPGVVLINPDQAEEAVLLVQVPSRTPDGKIIPRVVGLKITQDEVAKKMLSEYGVKSAKPGDVQGAKATQKEAEQKFVMVSGEINFSQGQPVITVEKYESAKELLAKAKAAEKNSTPQATIVEEKAIN